LILSFGGYLIYDVMTPDEISEGSENWKRASLNYKCSYEQFAKLKLESDYCVSNTKFTGRYCLSSAIIRNCVKNSSAQVNGSNSTDK
jgi:hypothetical protein